MPWDGGHLLLQGRVCQLRGAQRCHGFIALGHRGIERTPAWGNQHLDVQSHERCSAGVWVKRCAILTPLLQHELSCDVNEQLQSSAPVLSLARHRRHRVQQCSQLGMPTGRPWVGADCLDESGGAGHVQLRRGSTKGITQCPEVFGVDFVENSDVLRKPRTLKDSPLALRLERGLPGAQR